MTESRITTSSIRTALTSRRPLDAQDVMKAFFARRAPSTVNAYRGDLGQFAVWVDPEQCADLNAFSAWLFSEQPGRVNALLMEWMEEMLQAGLAPYTINRRLVAVRSLVKLGRTLGLINWGLDVQGVRAAAGVRDMRGPVPADIKKLFTAATVLGPQYLSILHLLYTRGLRSIEVRELRMEHLLLDRNEVLIRGKGKTGLQPLTVGQGVVAALKKWLAERDLGSAYVFPGSHGQQSSQAAIWRKVQVIGKAAGVKVRPHGLRHSAITAVLDGNDGNVREAQKFSRHQNPAVLFKHYDDARTDVGGKLTRMLDKQLEES